MKQGVNHQQEIRGTFAENISDKFIQTVGADTEVLLKGNRTENVKGNDKKTVGKNYSQLVLSDIKVTATKDLAQSSITGKTTMITGTSLNLKSAQPMVISSEDSVTFNAGTLMDINAGTEIDADAPIINLN